MSILTTLRAQYEDFAESNLRDYIAENKWTILAGIASAYVLYKLIRRPRNLPPGPWGWPVIGAVTELSKDDTANDYIRLCKKYKSDIVSLYCGKQLMVVMNNEDLIKEAFLKTDDFAYRNTDWLPEIFGLQDQLFFSDYSERWKKTKSLVITLVKNYGYGTPKAEENITFQRQRIIDHITKEYKETLSKEDLEILLSKATCCVMMKVMSNKHYEYDDAELNDIIKQASAFTKIFFEHAFTVFFLLNMFPRWLLWPFISNMRKAAMDSAAGLRAILQQHIEEHHKTLDENQPRDYLDAVLLENKDNPNMTDRKVIDTAILFLPDAVETMAMQITWCIFYISWHQEVQEKMFKEIDAVCGQRQPTLKDRASLLYCEAVIVEAMRMSTLVPIVGGHICIEDKVLNGYHIPKGTELQANVTAVHFDAKVFPDPKVFKPERFLGNGRLVNTEHVIPFGLGRRKCVGEPLTRSEAFLYVTGIVQHYSFNFADGHRPSSTEPTKTNRVPDFKLKFKGRN